MRSKPRISIQNASSGYLSGWIVLFLIAGLVAIQAWTKFAPMHEVSDPVSDNIAVRVIDGDTISLNDGLPNVRLVGFNAPETGDRARCPAERQLGERAKQRLHDMVDAGALSFREIACSCRPGSDVCNYGRRCGSLFVSGKDVGATLIAEGLAVRFVCSATGCPPLPRPWC
jgi:endonuclease YncB( thermonuclease family)